MSALEALPIAILSAIAGYSWSQSRRKPEPPKPAVHPCEIFHDLIPINAQPVAGGFLQTVCLKRCRNCHLHVSIVYTGDWNISEFLKTKSDIETLEGMMK